MVDRDASREAVAELDLAGVAGRRAARPGRLALGSGQAPPAVTVEQPY